MDVGQPGIRAGDTKMSPVCIPGCPTSEPSFPFIIIYYADNNA